MELFEEKKKEKEAANEAKISGKNDKTFVFNF